jgi:hypothetical protein
MRKRPIQLVVLILATAILTIIIAPNELQQSQAFHLSDTRFSRAYNLSETDDYPSIDPEIVAPNKSSNHVYVVWSEFYRRGDDNYDITFRKLSSTTNGTFFLHDKVNLSNNTGWSSNPDLEAFGNNTYVVWIDNTDTTTGSPSADNSSNTFFRRSTDNLDTFNSTIRLSKDNTGTVEEAQIAVSPNGTVYVVWQSLVNGTRELYFRASTDGNGSNFSDIINLSDNNNNNASSYDPQITVLDNSTVHIIWTDSYNTTNGNYSSILYRRSADSGRIFDDVKNLSNNTGNSTSAQIAASGSNVYVVWEARSSITTSLPSINGTTKEIYFVKSQDTGKNFASIINLSNNTGNSTSAQIAASGSNVYVVWSDNTFGNYDIFTKRSTNAGSIFGGLFSTINLSSDERDSLYPKVAATEKFVNVLWQSYTDITRSLDIYFRRSTDSGNTYDDTVMPYMTLHDGMNRDPQLTIGYGNGTYPGSDGIDLVWVYQNDRTAIEFGDIFFLRGEEVVRP